MNTSRGHGKHEARRRHLGRARRAEGGGKCPPGSGARRPGGGRGCSPGTRCVQHGGCWGHVLAAGWSTQQAGETWKTLASGLGTWRRPWAQSDTVAEDGGVGCPEGGLGAGPQRRNADIGAGAAKGEKPKKTSARKIKGKKEGERQEAGDREGRQPEIALGGPREGGSGSHGSGPAGMQT